MVLTIITLIVLVILVIISKKRIKKIDLYSTSLFAVVMAYSVDLILGEKCHLYGYFRPGVSYGDFMIFLGIYPLISMLFLNYFPFRRKARIKAVYIISWSLF